jgi:hypothetical protein
MDAGHAVVFMLIGFFVGAGAAASLLQILNAAYPRHRLHRLIKIFNPCRCNVIFLGRDSNGSLFANGANSQGTFDGDVIVSYPFTSFVPSNTTHDQPGFAGFDSGSGSGSGPRG